jgi:hypothetical protein
MAPRVRSDSRDDGDPELNRASGERRAQDHDVTLAHYVARRRVRRRGHLSLITVAANRATDECSAITEPFEWMSPSSDRPIAITVAGRGKRRLSIGNRL